VSDSDNEQKHTLECLRLASDLMQLGKEALKPDLKAHCIRLAGHWTDHAGFGPLEGRAPPHCLLH
jgi:hypothetical protein